MKIGDVQFVQREKRQEFLLDGVQFVQWKKR